MPAGLAALLDKRRFVRMRAKFEAWWEGVEPPADDALFEDEPAPEGPLPALEPLREPPPPPRLEALGLVWGRGRLFPGAPEQEAALHQAVKVPADGVLAVMGPGFLAPLRSFADLHPGPIRAYEWRIEAFGPLKERVKPAFAGRVALAECDLISAKLPGERLDGLVSLDDFTYADAAARMAAQIAKALRPDGRAVIEWYAGQPSKDLAPAFASAFAEPQIRPAASVLAAFERAGFAVEQDEDVGEEHLERARVRMKALAGELDSPPEGGMETLRELAWEIETFAARRVLLTRGRLQRRRAVFRRKA